MPRADHQSSEPPVFDPAVAYMTLDVMALATITTLQVAPPPIPPSPSTLDVVTVRPSDNSSKRPSIATSHDPTTSEPSSSNYSVKTSRTKPTAQSSEASSPSSTSPAECNLVSTTIITISGGPASAESISTVTVTTSESTEPTEAGCSSDSPVPSMTTASSEPPEPSETGAGLRTAALPPKAHTLALFCLLLVLEVFQVVLHT